MSLCPVSLNGCQWRGAGAPAPLPAAQNDCPWRRPGSESLALETVCIFGVTFLHILASCMWHLSSFLKVCLNPGCSRTVFLAPSRKASFCPLSCHVERWALNCCIFSFQSGSRLPLCADVASYSFRQEDKHTTGVAGHCSYFFNTHFFCPIVNRDTALRLPHQRST